MESLLALMAILVIASVAGSVWWRSRFSGGSSTLADSAGDDLLHWPATGGFDIHAVGEMADAQALAALARATDAGTGPLYATATLRLEPGAGRCQSAVSVQIDHRHAAYLSSADAAVYRARLNELGVPQARTICDAVVRPVRADQGRPPKILVQLDLDLACRPRMEQEVVS
jgi:hypothetical protein